VMYLILVQKNAVSLGGGGAPKGNISKLLNLTTCVNTNGIFCKIFLQDHGSQRDQAE
jgi:hypothetical protein